MPVAMFGPLKAMQVFAEVRQQQVQEMVKVQEMGSFILTMITTIIIMRFHKVVLPWCLAQIRSFWEAWIHSIFSQQDFTI